MIRLGGVLSRNFPIRATLYQQEKDCLSWIFCKNPENAGPAEVSSSKNERSSLTGIQHSAEPEASIYCSSSSVNSGWWVMAGSYEGNKKGNAIFTGTGARGRSGDVQLLRPRRIRSSRYHQISSGTCIPPGGWLFQPGAGAVRHMHRCGLSRHQFQVCRWMIAVRLLAFVHQSYGCCTIITHMRINHLKDRTLTQPITGQPKKRIPLIRVRSRFTRIRIFCIWVDTLPDIPEILPVQEHVDDEQGGEGKTCNVMIKDPVMPGYPHPCDPAASPPATGWQEEVQYQPGDERRDECYPTADIDQCIDSNAFHVNPS